MHYKCYLVHECDDMNLLVFVLVCCMCVCMAADLMDEVKPPTDTAVFPLWLVIVLILSSLSVLVVALMLLMLAVHTRLGTAAATVAALNGSAAFARMESGGRAWSNWPSVERRVWTNSHLEHSLPPPPPVCLCLCQTNSETIIVIGVVETRLTRDALRHVQLSRTAASRKRCRP